MTDDNIKEVINRTSIVDIINSTIPLKKKGNNYFGLSPFKKEKTPSFSVNEEKKIFHCFSTGEHGNVIDFLIKVKGCLLYTSPSPRDATLSRMPSSA